MKIAIGLAHGHAPKWLQTCIYTLKQTKNEVQSDIFVAHTWPGYPSIKAITETPLGENVKVLDVTIRRQSHATGIDEILDYIADKDEYEYLFATEDDCIAARDGWLDWYLSFMSNPKVAMAGFFWTEGNNHFNINPSGTIYRKDIILKYHKEVRANKEGIFWHPRGNRSDTEAGMDPTIKQVAGAFSETRGIKDPSKIQQEQILKGVPQAAWFEPGSCLYYWSLNEYEHVSVPVDHVYRKFGNHTAPEATYYGGRENPYYVHFWGGTRAWDHLKHPVTDGFVKGCSPHWLDRENAIWSSIVPQELRKKVDEVFQEMGLSGVGYDRH